MRFKTQPHKLPVVNMDSLVQHQQEKKLKRHGSLLSDNIRAVFCGPSNCGKTNVLLALILHLNGLRFESIHLYSKSLQQPKYQFLEKVLNDVDGVEYFPFHEHEGVVSPSQA